jgi:glycosyltransferase involved in cell wall biosynthesis
MTLHDYKLAAPCYLLFRSGSECTLCVGRRFPTPAIRYRCVKGSALGSTVCATEQVAHAPVYRRLVDAFIVPSEAARTRIRRSRAVDDSRLFVVPHGLPDAGHASPSPASTTFLFAGRLSPEKGAHQLLEAWSLASLPSPWRLVIAGDGSERSSLEAVAADLPVEFTGRLDADALDARMDEAAVVVVPSLVPETFGLAAAEAMARGIPVIVSDVGNLPTVVGDRRQVLPARDARAWADAMRWLAGSADERHAIGQAGRDRVLTKFSSDASVARLHEVYEFARRRSASRDVA